MKGLLLIRWDVPVAERVRIEATLPRTLKYYSNFHVSLKQR